MEHFYLHTFSPFVWEFAHGVGVRWYGLCYVLGFLAGHYLYVHLARRRLVPLPPQSVSDFITWGALFGVLLGGRLGYTLLYDFERFCREPLSILRVWEGGMASHGGILGLVVYTYYYARRHKVSWTGIGDGLVTVAPPGLFFVRVANFINGELYGRIASVSWAVQFPSELREHPELLDKTPFANAAPESLVAVLREGGPDAPALEAALRAALPPRYPSQLIEAALEGVVLFVVLWLMRTRLRVPRGVLTGAFFVLYALLRIAGEQFRQPEDFNFGLPRGVFLSFFLIGIGVLFLGFALKKPVYEAAFSAESSRQPKS
ncbi:MAG: prolipoprotein diacylglyceryl transferase [Verrucomicrobia bacterium]|nr:prolipoprotein diacylglyceryl transferase [Verrucomicrobiota bacterium]